MANDSPSIGPSKKKADLKVVILGDAYVGKTCLIRRYMDGVFYQDIPNDTAGEEKFAGLSSFYCRRANAAIVAYDMGSEESFLSIDNRYIKLLESAGDNCMIVLVGTKLDLINEDRSRQVHRERAIDKVNELSARWKSQSHPSGGIPYFETSSKTGEGVADVFNFIFETIVPPDRRETQKVVLNEESARPTHRSPKCC